MNLNAPPPSFAIDQIHDDCDQPYPQLIGTASSSSSVSCCIFLNSTRDHTGYDHHQLYQPDRQEDDDAYGYPVNGSSSYEMKNKREMSSLKLTLWKNKEADHDHDYSPDHMATEKCNSNPLKWMSSKMRLMQKMKNKPDPRAQKINTRKLEASSSSCFETGHDLSSKSSSYNNNSPIRVCGDCNTTKTPLWRSGPKGPKSLCNACGIRQRKARRALAAAANGTGVASDHTTTSSALKIKVLSKETHEHATTPLKKRYKMADSSSSTTAGSQSNGQRIEDFLMNFSKNLAFHRVFPEDEKDAAILLMALSSGLVHG